MSAISRSGASTRGETILVLSGGAPHSPLMAGALYSLDEFMRAHRKRPFDHIFAAGAGALVGLLLIAPKEGRPPDSLKRVLEMGIDDDIYRWFPVGYKAFFKPGPFTRPFRRLAQRFKLGAPDSVSEAWWRWLNVTSRRSPEFQRRYNDLVDLWFSLVTPTTLTYWSKGLCAPLPFVEDLVDFDAVGRFKGDFHINAYNLNRDDVEVFSKSNNQITRKHLRAALAFPFIYPPVEIGGHFYVEGAGHDPIAQPDPVYNAIVKAMKGRLQSATIVVIDILASLEGPLTRVPRNLWDAYGLSIIHPVLALAEKNLKQFSLRYPILKMDFKGHIDQEQWDYILDWNQSNLDELWKSGVKAGKEFAQLYGTKLPAA